MMLTLLFETMKRNQKKKKKEKKTRTLKGLCVLKTKVKKCANYRKCITRSVLLRDVN